MPNPIPLEELHRALDLAARSINTRKCSSDFRKGGHEAMHIIRVLLDDDYAEKEERAFMDIMIKRRREKLAMNRELERDQEILAARKSRA